jgi:hypothetical protein
MPDQEGMVGPEQPPDPRGGSTFSDHQLAPLTGPYHRLPKGTILPAGVAVVADGRDVRSDSPWEPTHHTIYPAERMLGTDFVKLFLELPWEYVGKKKK